VDASTPLIARWPAQIKETGGWTNQTGHVIDLMATCVDISQAKYPATKNGHPITPLEGKSLLPIFQNPEKTEPRTLYWEHEGNKAIRQGDWKLVKEHKQHWELYNLNRDRSELTNLAKLNPELVSTLSAYWDTWAQKVGVVPWGTLPQPGYNSKGPEFYRKK
jgi:arylsulfatase A-like enzyme